MINGLQQVNAHHIYFNDCILAPNARPSLSATKNINWTRLNECQGTAEGPVELDEGTVEARLVDETIVDGSMGYLG